MPDKDGCPFGQVNREKIEHLNQGQEEIKEAVRVACADFSAKVDKIYQKIDNHLQHMVSPAVVTVITASAAVIGVLTTLLVIALKK